MALHAVASAARLDAWYFRARPYRRAVAAGGGARHECAGLGPEELAGEGRRPATSGEKQGRSVRTLRDVLSISVRLRPETARHRRSRRSGAHEADGSVVNVARAELVRPGALLDALQAGRPGYAAVDVYEQEPIIGGNHPFLKMPNVLCTPHLGWAEWDNFELYFRECFEQIVRSRRASRCGSAILR